MLRTPVRLAAAAALVLGAAAVGAPPADAAAPCPGVSGVTVVVEFNGLGGGVDRDCAAEGGGHTADRLLKETGHALAYVQRFPGFVCRVDGLPADDPCVNTPPADAYWGLWWSDGKTGTWTYSSLGAGSLTVPAGGYVAMVWDGSAGQVAPGADPAPHLTPTPSPAPTKKPSPTAEPTPTTSPTATTPPTPTASPSKTPRPTPSKTRSATPTRSATDEPTDGPTDQATEAGGTVGQPPSDPPATTDDALPGWLAPLLVAALLVAAGAVAVVRRRA